MSKLFRRLMLEKLMAAHQAGRLQFLGSLAYLPDAKAFAAYLAPLRKKRWFVYAKRPFTAQRPCSPICRDTPTASPSRTAA